MSSASSNDGSDDDKNERSKIREDLQSMSFEELLNLKKELGMKVYKEAVLGVTPEAKQETSKRDSKDFKRLNKNRPREISSRRQVPFLGVELRTQKNESQDRDPRFDEKSGTYDAKTFKDNYKFISDVRESEVEQMKNQLDKTKDRDKRKEIKEAMQRLRNKNLEDNKWHERQDILKQEQLDIQKAHAEGRQPHYVTKRERRATELVKKFEQLKETGKLNKHLEKRRKKNAIKDRKKIHLD